MSASLGRRLAAEFIGTFTLVFMGVGSAVLAAAYPDLGIGFVGVAFAFGISLLVMAYAVGGISGCHINPAVTVGFAVAKRFPWRDVVPYIIAQVLGAIAAAAVLYAVASGGPDFSIRGGFGSNGYGTHSPGGYSFASAAVFETVMTLIFIFVILGATFPRAATNFAPIPVGLVLTGIHLVGIPVTNVSVNPARSTGPALFVGDWAIAQLWFFWVFPLLGAVLAGIIYPLLIGRWGPEEE